MDKIKTLLAGAVGSAATLALVVAIGAGGTDLAWRVGGEEMEITQQQFDAVAAVCASQDIWAHDIAGLVECRVRHDSDAGRWTAVTHGSVAAPYDQPPKDARGLTPAFVRELVAAQVE